MNPQTPHADVIELLVFELASVRHALPLACVREVTRAVMISPLPDAPPVIEGVVDVRGEILPVYDLRFRFGLPPAPLTTTQWLVTAWTGERVVAFRSDRADEIVTIHTSAIAARDQLPGAGAHITGVARLEDGLVLIDELRAFLDEAERQTLADAMAAREQAANVDQ